jgi:hypothetical protein
VPVAIAFVRPEARLGSEFVERFDVRGVVWEPARECDISCLQNLSKTWSKI